MFHFLGDGRIIPESVRWLLSRGKVRRAEKIVHRIASCNGMRLEASAVRVQMEELSRRQAAVLTGGGYAADKKNDIRDIYRQKGIRKHALVLFFVW